MPARTERTKLMIRTVLLASYLMLAGAVAPPPLYPGAVAASRPAGVGFKTPPAQTKTYVTTDDFATVKAWYAAHLSGAQEMQQPGMEKTEDAFLVGNADGGTVVMIQRYAEKTWIVIGPP